MSKRQMSAEEMLAFLQNLDFSDLKTELQREFERGVPFYEVDPSGEPETLIQVQKVNGEIIRTRGRLVNRVFAPVAEQA